MFGSLQKNDDDFLPPKKNKKNKKETPQMPVQMEVQQMQSNVDFGDDLFDSEPSGNCKTWLQEIVFPDIDQSLEVVSVIVTTHHDGSFDNLFRQIPQKVSEGRVSLYNLRRNGISKLLELMKDLPIKQRLPDEEPVEEEAKKEETTTKTEGETKEEKEGEEEDLPKSPDVDPAKNKKKLPPVQKDVEPERLLKEIMDIDPDCVLFNWECCGGCNDSGFGEKRTVEFVELLMKRGHTCMFSDFAVKALIGQWEEKRLGPKCLVKTGECQNSLKLNFDCKVLEESGIPQLQAVGKLCAEGDCDLHCLGGTVCVGIDWGKADEKKIKDIYKLKVLTVASKVDGQNPSQSQSKNFCEIGKYTGLVGHAVLTYAENFGELIISAGHWIELSKMDTSLERIEQWASSNYGNEYQEDVLYLKNENVSFEAKQVKLKAMSEQFVQQMPSVKNKKKKRTKYSYSKKKKMSKFFSSESAGSKKSSKY